MTQLPEYEALEKRTPEQRLELIKTWSDWFYQRTESFEGELGLQLAYLWPAIAKAHVIEVSASSCIVKLLEKFLVPKHSEIWGYIDQINDDEELED
jgi:hypothetical protein